MAENEQSSKDEFDALSDPEEAAVLYAALDSFRQYRRAAHYNITHLRRQSFYALPSTQIEWLSAPPFALPKTFEAVDDAVDANADLAEAIFRHGVVAFGLDPTEEVWKGHATPSDLDKARSTIRQFYRDWAEAALPERHASHFPIIQALKTYLPSETPAQRHSNSILVPGAGLARLVLDLCMEGYTVEGNEISYHQLLASNYVLNGVLAAGQYKLYPWALSFSNHSRRHDQLQSVDIPDIHPGTALEEALERSGSEVHHSERMSMTSGDFCVLYKQVEYAESFDAVVTCFFIDTAPNVIAYVDTVKRCLKQGGLWINLGPLLWHFESTPTPAERNKHPNSSTMSNGNGQSEGIGEPGSFELSNDEVLALVQHFGFVIVEQQESMATGYIQDPNSMLQNVYRPSFWVARKV